MILTNPQALESQGIILPITTEFKQVAQTFAQQCPVPEKALQIRQNTLAVCAVNAYLRLMDIETNIGDSDSWNPMMQVMANVADLKVPGVGVFSCRAVSSGNTCHIPPEDWHSRAGYIAVAIDESTGEATLLGFTATANESEEVPLENFAPIEALLDRVHSLRTEAETSTASASSDNILENISSNISENIEDTLQRVRTTATRLGEWADSALAGGLATGWQAVDALISPSDLNFAFRTNDAASGAATDISRAKLVDLGLQLGRNLQVALVIHLTPVSESQTDIVIQVRPLGGEARLPEGVLLSVLDESGALFSSTTSRAIDDYIQLPIIGEPGETFSVEISKGEATFSEQFMI